MSGETSSREVAGRVQFALKDAIPGNHGIPLSLLLNGRAETFAPYIKDADARVLTELVSEGIFAVPLEVRVRPSCARVTGRTVSHHACLSRDSGLRIPDFCFGT